jgi:hypothetical protein
MEQMRDSFGPAWKPPETPKKLVAKPPGFSYQTP